jgi:hypothetical protein
MINNRIVLIPVQSTQSRSASTTFLTTHLAKVLITQRARPLCVSRGQCAVGGLPSQLGSRMPMAPTGCAAPRVRRNACAARLDC